MIVPAQPKYIREAYPEERSWESLSERRFDSYSHGTKVCFLIPCEIIKSVASSVLEKEHII